MNLFFDFFLLAIEIVTNKFDHIDIYLLLRGTLIKIRFIFYKK